MSMPYPQQPAGQPAVPAQPAQAAQPVQQVVPQAGVPYSLAPQRQVPEKISRLSFILRSSDWVSWFCHSCTAPISLTVLCTVTIPKAVALYGSSRSPCTWAFFCPLILSV